VESVLAVFLMPKTAIGWYYGTANLTFTDQGIHNENDIVVIGSLVFPRIL
jgi:hypothetical protein